MRLATIGVVVAILITTVPAHVVTPTAATRIEYHPQGLPVILVDHVSYGADALLSDVVVTVQNQSGRSIRFIEMQLSVAVAPGKPQSPLFRLMSGRLSDAPTRSADDARVLQPSERVTLRIADAPAGVRLGSGTSQLWLATAEFTDGTLWRLGTTMTKLGPREWRALDRAVSASRDGQPHVVRTSARSQQGQHCGFSNAGTILEFCSGDEGICLVFHDVLDNAHGGGTVRPSKRPIFCFGKACIITRAEPCGRPD